MRSDHVFGLHLFDQANTQEISALLTWPTGIDMRRASHARLTLVTEAIERLCATGLLRCGLRYLAYPCSGSSLRAIPVALWKCSYPVYDISPEGAAWSLSPRTLQQNHRHMCHWFVDDKTLKAASRHLPAILLAEPVPLSSWIGALTVIVLLDFASQLYREGSSIKFR